MNEPSESYRFALEMARFVPLAFEAARRGLPCPPWPSMSLVSQGQEETPMPPAAGPFFYGDIGNFPTPPSGEHVVARVFYITVNGVEGSPIEQAMEQSTFRVGGLELDDHVRVELGHKDQSGNVSDRTGAPAIEWVVADTFAPSVPGMFGLIGQGQVVPSEPMPDDPNAPGAP